MSVSSSIAKNTVMTYFSLHVIANKTLELVYENAPECTILKWKTKKMLPPQSPPRCGRGHPSHIPSHLGAEVRRLRRPPPLLFGKLNTDKKSTTAFPMNRRWWPWTTLNAQLLFCVIPPNSTALEADYVNVVEDRPYMSSTFGYITDPPCSTVSLR